MTQLAHIRIEMKTGQSAGAPHIVTNDRIIAVGDDGYEIDISGGVTGWRLRSQVGEARAVELTFLAHDVQQSARSGELRITARADVV